jgi:hypothetical protein
MEGNFPGKVIIIVVDAVVTFSFYCTNVNTETKGKKIEKENCKCICDSMLWWCVVIGFVFNLSSVSKKKI